MQSIVRQILNDKGTEVFTIGPDDSVFAAIQIMSDKCAGALLVTQGEQILGIVTERDYARKVILKDRSSKSTPVSAIMTTDLITVAPGESITTCMNIMTEKRVRHLPVIEGDRLEGLVSQGDLVRRIISSQKETIDQLESYISSG